MRGYRIIESLLDKLRQPFHYRKVSARLFSGKPLIEEISFSGNSDLGSVLLVRFKNGLLLTLGEGGILDFQDQHFSAFMKNEGFAKLDFLVQLHKVVLKSLLKFMIHPATTVEQRERAAAAISNLWLAENKKPENPGSAKSSILKQILVPIG